jgi:hypothetical protein
MEVFAVNDWGANYIVGWQSVIQANLNGVIEDAPVHYIALGY